MSETSSKFIVVITEPTLPGSLEDVSAPRSGARQHCFGEAEPLSRVTLTLFAAKLRQETKHVR
jgi:hypothetical protein